MSSKRENGINHAKNCIIKYKALGFQSEQELIIHTLKEAEVDIAYANYMIAIAIRGKKESEIKIWSEDLQFHLGIKEGLLTN
jgi:hypothetical protein